MARVEIDLGVIPTGEGGDTYRSAMTKINGMTEELFEGIDKLPVIGDIATVQVVDQKLAPVNLAISNKVDQVEGKGLSTNDYTTAEKTRLAELRLVNSTSDITEGDKLFFTASRVLDVVLAGLSVATGGPIIDTDSVLAAFGKIQNQLTDLATNKLSLSGGHMTGPINLAPEQTFASAATVELGDSTSNNVVITGTVPITSLGVTAPTGSTRSVRFTASCVMGQSTTLILPGAKNVVFDAGDVATFVKESATAWRMTGLIRGDGSPDSGDNTAAVAVSSGVLNLLSFTGRVVTVALTQNVTSILLPGKRVQRNRDLTIIFTQGGAANFTVSGWPVDMICEGGGPLPALYGTVGLSTVYELNCPQSPAAWTMKGRTIGSGIPWVRTPTAQRIVVGTANATALVAGALVAARASYMPFTVPRPMHIVGVGYNVRTANAGTGSIAIFDSVYDSATLTEKPGNKLAGSADGAMAMSVGTKIADVDIWLLPGRVYWVGMISTTASSILHIPLAAVLPVLGFGDNLTTAVTHLTQVSTTNVLPANPESPATQITIAPAFYLVEG